MLKVRRIVPFTRLDGGVLMRVGAQDPVTWVVQTKAAPAATHANEPTRDSHDDEVEISDRAKNLAKKVDSPSVIPPPPPPPLAPPAVLPSPALSPQPRQLDAVITGKQVVGEVSGAAVLGPGARLVVEANVRLPEVAIHSGGNVNIVLGKGASLVFDSHVSTSASPSSGRASSTTIRVGGGASLSIDPRAKYPSNDDDTTIVVGEGATLELDSRIDAAHVTISSEDGTTGIVLTAGTSIDIAGEAQAGAPAPVAASETAAAASSSGAANVTTSQASHATQPRKPQSPPSARHDAKPQIQNLVKELAYDQLIQATLALTEDADSKSHRADVAAKAYSMGRAAPEQVPYVASA